MKRTVMFVVSFIFIKSASLLIVIGVFSVIPPKEGDAKEFNATQSLTKLSEDQKKR